MIEAVIGVDPGAHGAVACKLADRRLFVWNFAKMTEHECAAVFKWLGQMGIRKSYIERVNNRPGQANTFAYGENCGVVRGYMIMTTGYEYVEAKRWQYHHNLGGPQHEPGGCKPHLIARGKGNHRTGTACEDCEYRARKNVHKEMAFRLHSELKVTLENADAILIADYAWDLAFGGFQDAPKTTILRPGTGIVRIVTRAR
jgi:hypothetical protein